MLARDDVIILLRMSFKFLTKWTKVVTKKNNTFILISKCQTTKKQHFLIIALPNLMKFLIISKLILYDLILSKNRSNNRIKKKWMKLFMDEV